MNPLARIAERWRNMPVAATGVLVALLLIAGFAVIVQNEAVYHGQKVQETRVQAEILAASVVAALDFDDEAAARESVDALRVNPQVRMVAIYGRKGELVAGYAREPGRVPASFAQAPRTSGDTTIAIAPVTRSGERIGTAYLVADPQPFSARIARYLLITLLVVMAALVVAVLGLAQAALRRANAELAERATALADANQELTHQVGERAKAEDQLRQAQKMQALGQLTGGIAHDFNNLLTVIQGSADMLSRPGIAEDRRRRFADAIVQASGRAAALTGQLLAFARRQPLQPEVIDLNTMVSGMTELLDRTLGERFAIRTDLAAGACTVEADRAQLASAVLNIAVNARDAMPDGGTLIIATERLPGDTIALSVSDNGTGMDEATLARAMEPFFTTKITGKGTGLGLSQAYGFATQSGGDLKIESAPGKGTKVSILLPWCEAPATPAAEAAPIDPARMRTGAVLLVEDNEEVGEFAETLLRELGHDVTRARLASEALEAVAKQDFDVVFTDVVMPVMSGLELAEELHKTHPDLPVVLTTGYSDEIARSGTGGRPVLLKPYRIEALAAVLDDALASTEAG
jgi:signal transduction histidine kinase/CheY-like chemotaxis protein